MTRIVLFLGLGGCLLGWQPEPLDTGTASTSTPTIPGCTPPSGTDFCATYDARSVTVGASLTPVVSSDLGISDLYVYRDTELQWHAWSDDNLDSLYAFTYGETPNGTSAGGPATALVAGVEYEVQLDAICVDQACAPAVSSVYQVFTAEP